MKKEIALLVAASCIGAGAATVNYDLLGRKGSKMNSPMVYKNIDYSKMKKKEQQNVGSSLENKTLKRLGTGLNSNYRSIAGVYNNKGLDYYMASSQNPYPYYLKWWKANGSYEDGWYNKLAGNGGYMDQSNAVFKSFSLKSHYPPAYKYAGISNVYGHGYNMTWLPPASGISNPVQSSPYAYYQQIRYEPFGTVEMTKSKRSDISWYDESHLYPDADWGDVGVYMVADAEPVSLRHQQYDRYVLVNPNEQFSPDPVNEMLSARSYRIIKDATNFSVVYVSKNRPSDPSSDARGPQIYVGLHNRGDVFYDNEDAMKYSTAARDLDNYIYNNRTTEIVAVGNYMVRLNTGHLAAEAHAANAITVGAVDAYSGEITSYNSTKSKYCTLGIGGCNGLSNTNEGSRKPEIYNYSHFYFLDEWREYTDLSSGVQYSYDPFYDGNEMSAAYTASMVAELLSVNPFYRWHPEVVKALLLTSGDVSVSPPYPEYYPVTSEIPSYRSLVFDKNHNSYFHESRYWVGETQRLKTHVEPYSERKEIRFKVKRPAGKTNFKAAIAWLSSGNDIANLGRVPQDFDLYVYESNDGNVDNIDVYNSHASSLSGIDAYEKISFTSNANYLVFRILLYRDLEDSENNGQMVLGFDVAAK
ncbi:S8 family serine peptidase [Fibrobacter succinogenes]|uniref:S8 family serine peptidase n=1 Tax=Fibrobacter succinogenes TaxID=833 RepID=UPI0015695A1D|nr:S8 family serine peptidase [Fibrobacter succinogenes]